MAEQDDIDDGEEPKKRKGGILLGLALATISGGIGFSFTSGMLSGAESVENKPAMLSDGLAFVPLEPMTVSIGKPSEHRFLRFRAELEVAEDYQEDITKMMPRVVDVLNTYLQSLEMEDIEEPSSLLKLRSQMRRRVDLIVGGNRVNDLLVMEFVVN